MHHSLMDKPIPDLSALRADKSFYRKHLVHPSPEACVLVNDRFLCQSYYWYYKPRPYGAMENIFLRRILVDKLDRINRSLLLSGLKLLIQEGYRPLSVQRFVQEVSVMKGLKKEYPKLKDVELEQKVRMFAASTNGDLHSSPPPHLTGGAVDLTIVHTETGKQVDMGKSGGLYNTAFPDALESLEGFEEAKRFRRLLFWLAQEQKITVNPTEWWHLSWGDQMWAWISKEPYAVYGIAESFR